MTSFGRMADLPPEWTETVDDPAAATGSSYHIKMKDYYVLVCVPAGDLWSAPDEVTNLPCVEALESTSKEERGILSGLESTEECLSRRVR